MNLRVMLALGRPDDEFDVGLVEAVAELPAAPSRDVMPAGHLGRDREQLRAIGLDEAEYWRTYSQPIAITPTRFLPWHGRTEPGGRPPPGRIAAGLRRLLQVLRRPTLGPVFQRAHR
jgi:hypothetical protein